MTEPLDFQSIIFTLQRFWAEQGCLIAQPYYSQVGAGTMNPATVLRVLGPEPWNVGYVEPSVRPDDGRYGENPNRLQMHTQFQVILKPDPGNPQELYLRSLEALGIDPRSHDIRFVEDNWESPALGAWGLGWEVWLDGQEITQFTYFQQAGGQTLDPVSVEITYGLERIAMTLQGVRNFRELRWSPTRTYGDVHLAGEQEHSRYYFEVADVQRLRQMYDLFEQEAELAIKNGMVLPAHDYILKCSHTFNVLDSRGVVGVTDRQALFARMRDLSRRVAEVYLAQRQQLEYPWLTEGGQRSSLLGALTSRPVPVDNISTQPLNGPADFLLEIGTEELPVTDLNSALAQLRDRFTTLLDDLRLTHGPVKVAGTPRRLVVTAEAVSERQPDREVVVKGPPASRSFDALGVPTKAAEGFARSKGLDVSALQIREMDGGSYAAAVVFEKGRPALDVLAEALPGLVAGIKFDKSMRWNWSNVAFSRPVRWLAALLGETVVPFEYAGLKSGRRTRGLRFRTPEEFVLTSPADYIPALHSQGILLELDERKQVISRQVAQLMEEVGAVVIDPGLLDEVANLVEAPTAVRGIFEQEYLSLPPEVLISVMKKHQRYFPVVHKGDSKKLLPYFIAVRNGDAHNLHMVADGNEQVIRARFADARFFVGEDLTTKLEDFLPGLAKLTFQQKLGSMLDKTGRIERLVRLLSPLAGLNDLDEMTALRTAHLCKADLASHMVVEMTSLQGIMGRHYAHLSGEQDAVADAIFEHYLPRNADDAVPQSAAGLVVGLADRINSLAGLFAAGLAPTGTKDPFAQRRTALGLVQLLVQRGLDVDLRQALELAAGGLPVAAPAEVQAACLDFIVGRMRSYLIEQAGYRYDVVDAVLAVQQHNPASVVRSIQSLSAAIARPDWQSILPTYSRCVRITRDQAERFVVRPEAFVEPVEQSLFQALHAVHTQPRRAGSMEDFWAAFLPLMPEITRFFEGVLVMAEDPAVRANRLGMLQQVAALANGVADFSKLEGF